MQALESHIAPCVICVKWASAFSVPARAWRQELATWTSRNVAQPLIRLRHGRAMQFGRAAAADTELPCLAVPKPNKGCASVSRGPGRKFLRHARAGTLKARPFTQITQGAIWLSNACIRVADACFALGVAARSTRPHRCRGGYATFMLPGNTPLFSNDTT